MTSGIQCAVDASMYLTCPNASPLIFLTPLCAARARRRKEVEALLVRRGAKEDIFTHAFLGDLGRLDGDLVRELSSLTVDPAIYVL